MSSGGRAGLWGGLDSGRLGTVVLQRLGIQWRVTRRGTALEIEAGATVQVHTILGMPQTLRQHKTIDTAVHFQLA
eukprot:COSAG02_NODE_37512_length_441_cov_0.669591_2_plen_74_part_01